LRLALKALGFRGWQFCHRTSMRLYVATTNPGKLRDLAHAAEGHLLDGKKVRIEPLPGVASIPAPPEDELTFEGNARAKAVYYSRRARGVLVLADDSGLEVACLANAPGVRSARYAEDQAQAQNFPVEPASTLDERNNAALLRALDGIPEGCRQARYRCVLALARSGEVLTTAEGTVEGSILMALRGMGGFGYDPLFLLLAYNQTMAEVDLAIRLAVSHRGRALRALLEQGAEVFS
jgi:XTP/dITP diphosphohydrolase